jgi:ribonuclease VapC
VGRAGVIVVDTSSLLSLLLKEPDQDAHLSVVAGASGAIMSACGVFEASTRAYRLGGPDLDRELDMLIQDLGIAVVPIDLAQLEGARAAFRRYGKGTGHRAGLNLGDCFAYALAKSRGLPLLFKGYDFIHTDIASAL